MLRIAVLLALALIYAAFDMFNNRNVPNYFVYASVIIAAVITLTYPLHTVYVSALVAIVIFALGYMIYRKGFLGAGDVFEFVAISLVLPIQPAPILADVSQFGLPFIFSVFVTTGYASLIGIVIYYLFVARRSPMEKDFRIEKQRISSAAVLLISYIIMLAFVYMAFRITIAALVLVLLIAVPSALVIVYERKINMRMVAMVYPAELEEGDMIATNLMKRSEIRYFKSKANGFGRLATNSLISEIKGIKRRLPVYRNAVPLAFFVLVGVVVSLIVGNVLLLIVTL
jgi:Flp pilus assembly protein protease CpaA